MITPAWPQVWRSDGQPVQERDEGRCKQHRPLTETSAQDRSRSASRRAPWSMVGNTRKCSGQTEYQ